MRAPIFFYIGRNYPSSATGEGARAVPVHIVYDVNESGLASVRVLAGRMAGSQITIDRSELHRSPGSARLVPGSRKAIVEYGLRELEAATEARALRKRIGSWRGRLTERQLRNAFEQTMTLATHVRSKTQNDRAWRYFDGDVEDWHAGNHTGALLIRMIDMVLGAAERYQPPPVDQRSAVYARAITLEDDANLLANAIGAPAREAPRRWLEVADALEVAEDAWHEAGDEDRADSARAKRQNILTTIKLAYGPRRQR